VLIDKLKLIEIAFNLTKEGIIISDSDGVIVFTNISIENYFGYKSEDLIGKNIEILIPKPFKREHQSHFDFYMRDTSYLKNSNYREVMGLNNLGVEIPLEIRLNLFSYEDKKYAIAFIIDITLRKEKENESQIEKMQLEEIVKDSSTELQRVVKQLQKTNKELELEIKRKILAKDDIRKALIAEREVGQLKSKFLSLASHEFRTPLSGILTSASLINKYLAPFDKPKIIKHTDTIISMVKHLSQILDDFLSLDKLENGSIEYKFTKFDCNTLLQEIIKDTYTLMKKDQKIIFIPCNEPILLFQDKKIVSIIISNLIYNAIKYSFENQSIEIEVTSEENLLKIKVSDHGLGIPENEQKFIFKRFFRASNVSHIQGTGIGLNIIKQNVEGLGGKITFKSKENNGSVFIVEIPKNITL
jgi:PAS domain S-box-containing protein